MFNIKQLEWVKRDWWVAESPASKSGYIMIALEQGKYWPLWSCDLPGYETLEEAMAKGQEFHNSFLEQFLETVK